jgi:hypothetical protein
MTQDHTRNHTPSTDTAMNSEKRTGEPYGTAASAPGPAAARRTGRRSMDAATFRSGSSVPRGGSRDATIGLDPRPAAEPRCDGPRRPARLARRRGPPCSSRPSTEDPEARQTPAPGPVEVSEAHGPRPKGRVSPDDRKRLPAIRRPSSVRRGWSNVAEERFGGASAAMPHAMKPTGRRTGHRSHRRSDGSRGPAGACQLDEPGTDAQARAGRLAPRGAPLRAASGR